MIDTAAFLLPVLSEIVHLLFKNLRCQVKRASNDIRLLLHSFTQLECVCEVAHLALS